MIKVEEQIWYIDGTPADVLEHSSLAFFTINILLGVFDGRYKRNSSYP
jgi:hypothetical protein